MSAFSIPMFAMDGSKSGTMELPERLFPSRLSPALVHQVVSALRANQRKPLAHSRTRGEVSGGGKKPWRQKGTGRARQGSIRSPQWKGGGVVFGPRKTRTFEQKINDTMKKKAFAMVLKSRLEDNCIAVIDPIETTASPKTKTMATALNAIHSVWKPGSTLKATASILMVVEKKSHPLLRRMARNLSMLRIIDVAEVGVMDMIASQEVLLTRPAMETLARKIGSTLS